jgi:FixJ family two-component response regulator
MACVLAFVDDLFFQAKILETAKHVGVDVRTYTAGHALLEALVKKMPGLVIVDLNARNHPLDVIRSVHAAAKELKVIAFLSHVQVGLAEQAREAGCAHVMARSQFAHDLATILAATKSDC